MQLVLNNSQYAPFYKYIVNVPLTVAERWLNLNPVSYTSSFFRYGPFTQALHYQLLLLLFAVISSCSILAPSAQLKLCKTWSPHSFNGAASRSLNKEKHQHLSAGLRGSFKGPRAQDALSLHRLCFLLIIILQAFGWQSNIFCSTVSHLWIVHDSCLWGDYVGVFQYLPAGVAGVEDAL